MPLISDHYRSEQAYLHFVDQYRHKYGSGGPQFVGLIGELIDQYGITDLLDYGCGKGLLAKAITRVPVQCYDPAIPEFQELPMPADMLVCLDVLEHIEPDCLEEVLAHIGAVTKRLLFVSISLKKAGRFMRDGRNAHLIVEDQQWWQQQLERKGFSLTRSIATAKMEWVALLQK